MSREEGQIYRFSEFTVDPIARTLTRRGLAIPLNRRSFDLLLCFVQNSGRVLGKNELLRQVWPDVFVDENSLAKSVSVLRKALEENGADGPYVLTLPGRGYQFGATVEIVIPRQETLPDPISDGETTLEAAPPAIGLLQQRRAVRTTVSEFRQGPPRFGSRRVLLLTGAALALGAIAGYLLSGHLHPAPQSALVVLADLEDTTGNETFGFALKRALQIDLEQSPFLEILPQAAVQETLIQMRRGADEPLTLELAREICERNDGQAVIDAAMSKLAGLYLLTVNAWSCVTERNLAGFKAQVASASDLLPALDLAADRIRTKLGESGSSLARFRTPMAKATTGSLEALRAYTQGLASLDRGDSKVAKALFQRAIALDVGFASAWKALGDADIAHIDYAEAAEAIAKAYSLRSRAAERERLDIEIAYNENGDWEAAITSMQLYNQIYPNDAANWYGLCAMNSELGQLRQAVEAGEQAWRLAPHSGSGAATLVRAYRRAGRFAEAKRVAAAAIREGKDQWKVHSDLFQIAYAMHDADGMRRETAWGFDHHEPAQTLTNLGFVAANRGRLREATDDFIHARQEALASGDTDFAAGTALYLAAVQLEVGEIAAADATLRQVEGNAFDPGDTAFFRADLGDLTAARAEIAKIESSGTRSTLQLRFDLPLLKGLLALKTGKAAEAVKDFDPSRKYQLRDYGIPYQRARAEVAAGMLDKAAEDYHLILANPGIDPLWTNYSLSHLGLARVYALQKKYSESRTEYQTFLSSWKEGDPDVPLLIQVKEEYAKLPLR